jgi:hypothetical protein
VNESTKYHGLKKMFRIFKLEEADCNAVVTGCKPKKLRHSEKIKTWAFKKESIYER